MALPDFSLRQLLEAGVHFGHQTQRWNPRMAEFIYGARNGIHIIDLTQTVPMLDAALNAVRETVAKGGRILFVGTKRQAQRPIAEAAEKCAQYYMNHRWLGGTLTNWKTVSNSINRLKALDEQLAGDTEGLTKKERLGMEREQSKLQASLGGIREMGGVPDLLFVIDVQKEDLAIAEAKKLGIPVVAVVDTNCPPDGIDFLIPGNDDAARAISLYTDLASRAALDGMSAQLGAAGIDLGASEEAPVEAAIAEPEASDPATEKATAKDVETRGEAKVGGGKVKAKAKAKADIKDGGAETKSEEKAAAKNASAKTKAKAEPVAKDDGAKPKAEPVAKDDGAKPKAEPVAKDDGAKPKAEPETKDDGAKADA